MGCFGGQNTPLIFDGVFCPPKHPTTEYGVFGVYMVGVFLTWGVLGGHLKSMSIMIFWIITLKGFISV